MNKTLFYILILNVVTISIHAQVTFLNSPFNTNNIEDSTFVEVGTNMYSYLGSNSINNHFVRTVFKSKYLDDQIKNSNY